MRKDDDNGNGRFDQGHDDFDMNDADDRQIAADLEACIREDNRKDPEMRGDR